MENFTSEATPGCYYFNTFYPANFALPDKDLFTFEKDSIKFYFMVIQHLKSLITNDFGNRIIVTNVEGKHFYTFQKKELSVSDNNMCLETEDGGVYLLDHQKHFHQEFFTLNHTEVVVFFETTLGRDNYQIAYDAFSYFLNSYRVVSGDILALSPEKISLFSRIFRFHFHRYSEEELTLVIEKRVLTNRQFVLEIDRFHSPLWNTQGARFDKEPAKISTELKGYFSKNKRASQIFEFVLKASEELYVHKNFKYSFLESWTGLEIAIVNFLKEKKVEKGISKNRIDDFDSEIGISYYINIELQLVATVNDQRLKALIADMNSMRKLRNAVIHENAIVTRNDATKGLSVLGQFLEYIQYKKY